MRRFLSVLSLVALVSGGCSIERHRISSPGASQTIRAESGDRWFMDLEEDSAAGYRWHGTSNDSDVDVIIEHVPGRDGGGRVGALGKAEVTIRVFRGYDGPSTVTFTYKRQRKKPEKSFTITLFRRTGDSAFWK